MTRKKGLETPLSHRLKETAKATGLSAERIAATLGKTPGAVRHWWSARNEPSFDDLEAYGRLVERSAYYLLTGQDDQGSVSQAAAKQVQKSLATMMSGGARSGSGRSAVASRGASARSGSTISSSSAAVIMASS